MANEPLILPEYCVTNALAPLGENLRIVYRTDHDDRALALVASGQGLALLPGQFDSPDVRHVPISDLGVSRKVGLVWQREQDDSQGFSYLCRTPSLVVIGPPKASRAGANGTVPELRFRGDYLALSSAQLLLEAAWLLIKDA